MIYCPAPRGAEGGRSGPEDSEVKWIGHRSSQYKERPFGWETGLTGAGKIKLEDGERPVRYEICKSRGQI